MAAAYTRGLFELASGGTVWTSSTIVALLVRSGYVYSPGHNVIADLSNEVTGGGYARQTLVSMSVLEHDDDGEARFFAAWPTFVNLTTTNVIAVVIARSTGSDATSPLLFYLDFPTPLNRTAADLVVAFPTNGVSGARLG